MRKTLWDKRYNGREATVFVPALTPFEAAMLPALEKPDRAALHYAQEKADWSKRFGMRLKIPGWNGRT